MDYARDAGRFEVVARAGATSAPELGQRRQRLVAEWLELTRLLLGDFDVTVEELQELVAMQAKVSQVVNRTVTEDAPETVVDQETGVVYRKVRSSQS